MDSDGDNDDDITPPLQGKIPIDDDEDEFL